MGDQLPSGPASAPRVDVVVRDNGRRVAVRWLADGEGGRTLVLCHPAPGAGNLDPDSLQTLSRGARLLGVDRPGYGQSDPVPDGSWASVSAAADDLAAALEGKAHGPVGAVGWSAGGRVALALAARRPDLVDRVVVLATPAPHEQVPWIPIDHQTMLEQLRGAPPEQAHAALREQLKELLPTAGSTVDAAPLLASGDADAAALQTPAVRAQLAAMLEAAFAQGVTGLASDIAGYCLQPWGFEMAAVQAKTLLLYGNKDSVVGTRHGSWWQKRLPNARLEVVPGAGHLLIFAMWQRVLTHLAPKARR